MYTCWMPLRISGVIMKLCWSKSGPINHRGRDDLGKPHMRSNCGVCSRSVLCVCVCLCVCVPCCAVTLTRLLDAVGPLCVIIRLPACYVVPVGCQLRLSGVILLSCVCTEHDAKRISIAIRVEQICKHLAQLCIAHLPC